MKKTLTFLCLLIFCNMTLFAQTGKRPRLVRTPEKSLIHVPGQEPEAGLRKIYSNLGPSKTYLYNDTYARVLEGPNSGHGLQFLGMPFTPKLNAHVSQVQVAVQYYGFGANQINLSIYADSEGVPGTLLAGPVTVANLPEFGTCCTLAVASFSQVAVSAGSQYWVVADTPPNGTGSDFVGAWDFNITFFPTAYNVGQGWARYDAIEESAGEVLGTIP